MVDCGGIENRYPVNPGSWVRIPLSPPNFAEAKFVCRSSGKHRRPILTQAETGRYLFSQGDFLKKIFLCVSIFMPINFFAMQMALCAEDRVQDLFRQLLNDKTLSISNVSFDRLQFDIAMALRC